MTSSPAPSPVPPSAHPAPLHAVPLRAVPLGDWADPARVFAGGPARHPHAFWLDAGPDALAGHSYLGVGSPVAVETVLAVELAARGTDAADAADGADVVDADGGELPAGIGGFRGGYVGWFGYEWGAAHAGLGPTTADGADPGPEAAAHTGASALQPAPPPSTPPTVPSAVPPAGWLRVDEFVAFDHAAARVWLVARPERVAAFTELVRGWIRAGEAAASTAPVPAAKRVARSSHSAADHAALVGECLEIIRDGDAYQLCLTTQFTVPAGPAPFDAPGVFAALRASSPSHHGGFIRTQGTAVLSASPEQFLGVSGGRVQTKPIKGTRPRGRDAAADAALAAELRASVKEQAENIMIVDLMRNDLARICEPGSVGVDALLQVESYAQVHQLVSTVSGRLRAGSTVSGLLAATFPAGSMTGAPKRSAMAQLRRLERAERGIYSGCWGYIGFDGTADLAMVIRTIIVRGDVATVGSGGGITAGSVVDEEVREVGVKVRAPLAVLGAAVPQGW